MLGLAQIGSLAIGQIPPVNTDFPAYPDHWLRPLSEPKRFKPILGPGLNLFNSMPFPFIKAPSNAIFGWLKRFDEPVWPKKGLKPHLQQTLAHPPLKIAKPSVFLTLAAKDSTTDTAIFGIDVYSVPPAVYVLIAGVNVTINEIQSTKGGAASIAEE